MLEQYEFLTKIHGWQANSGDNTENGAAVSADASKRGRTAQSQRQSRDVFKDEKR
jgi:hypothetical protein